MFQMVNPGIISKKKKVLKGKKRKKVSREELEGSWNKGTKAVFVVTLLDD